MVYTASHSWTKQVRLEESKLWSNTGMIVFLVGFAWQLYWSWPMLSLLFQLMQVLCPKGPRSLTKAVMVKVLKNLKQEFRYEKVRDGMLVEGAPGQHPCSNPSERRPGWVRCDKLLKDWDKWWACAKRLASVLDSHTKVEIGPLLYELNQAEMKAYSGSKTQYASVRFVRMLIHCSSSASTAAFADSKADWIILRKMSKHVRDVILAYGLQRYDDALAMRKSMRKLVPKGEKGYSFSDLIIFLCLLDDKKKKKKLQWE